MKIHFIGIGGIGISAVAQFCMQKGHQISGSDLQKTEVFSLLKKDGIKIYLNQKKENIPANCDLIVYTEAISKNNPELIEGQKRNIPIKSYFEFLGEISRDFKTIAIAGTHGKTTTTGLVCAGLKKSAIKFNGFVGARIQEFNNSNFYYSNNAEYLVCEACEYRENFKYLHPEIVILTHIDYDHKDSFPTKESYFTAFERLISKAKTVIFHNDDKNAHKILKNFKGNKIPTENSEKVDLKIIGEFNQRNARLAKKLHNILAKTYANSLELPINSFLQGMSEYAGATRRQEFLGEKNGVKIYDDYAHHPVEIAALLKGFRQELEKGNARNSDKKIGIVFEPHQFSRTREFFREFCSSLDLADEVGIFPIYAARDTEEDKKFSRDNFFETKPSFVPVSDNEEMNEFFAKFSNGDILIFCGAGRISEFARNWLNT